MTKINSKITPAKRYLLLVSKSIKHTDAQVVDPGTGRVIAAVIDRQVSGKTKTERAHAAGLRLAQNALKKGVVKVVFDRRGWRYHGRVQALADGAREGGLVF
jgi:large subunit ribosomal protein L18